MPRDPVHDDPPHRKTMHREEAPDHARFLTFSTLDRLPLFQNDRIKDLFIDHLAEARHRGRFHLYAWVVMPEHIHLLLWPRIPEHPVEEVLRELKRRFGKQVIARWRDLRAPILERITRAGRPHFWLPGGGHDRNIWSMEQFAEKLRYIHQNPVKRGLCARPEDWRWSSARWYHGDRSGLAPDPLPPRRPVGG